jgi:hypothetical protein
MAIRDQRYEEAKDIIYDLLKILHLTSDLGNVINKLPEGVTIEEMKDSYNSKFNLYSIEYARKRKKLAKKLDDYLESDDEFLESDEADFGDVFTRSSIFPQAQDYRDFILNQGEYSGGRGMPPKYTQALENKEPLTTVLKLTRLIVVKSNLLAKKNLDSLLGVSALRDFRIKKLREKVVTSFQNQALTSTILDRATTVQVKQQMLTADFNKVKNTIAEFTSLLENFTSFEGIDRLTSSNPGYKGFLKKIAQLNRNPINNLDEPRNSLENFWRERVRDKFGGNLPFCDEVDSDGVPIKVTDENGVARFAKATDVIDLGDKNYVLKSKINMDELRKSLRSDNYNSY